MEKKKIYKAYFNILTLLKDDFYFSGKTFKKTNKNFYAFKLCIIFNLIFYFTFTVKVEMKTSS